ncbi:hypothetical protein SY89_02518 [Halolamina pelagica]|uniref:Uncharacterized protein n=1 Tax=Halolamina pelagica TaxID=699431 RepID=A0A0P7HDN2_9EURY|nr:hypothetical protein SY89_02518 [Halolamina pelagica]
MTESLRALQSAAAAVIEDAMAALVAEENDEAIRLANGARERVQEIDGNAREIDALLRDLDPARAQLLGLIVDSLSRSADYGGTSPRPRCRRRRRRPDREIRRRTD